MADLSNLCLVTRSDRDARDVVWSADKMGVRYSYAAPEKKSRPETMLDARKLWPGRDILYVEQDSVFRRPPELFAGADFDVAAFIYRADQSVPPAHMNRWDGLGWIHPYTFFFRDTPEAVAVLTRWRDLVQEEKDQHMRLLHEVRMLTNFLAKAECRFRYLPKEYGWIERIMRRSAKRTKPVIEHRAKEIPHAPPALGPEVIPNPLVHGFTGLGDNFYMRPAIRALMEHEEESVYFETPWIQFWGQERERGLKIVRPTEAQYRTQGANVDRLRDLPWVDRPRTDVLYRMAYHNDDLRKGLTPARAFLRCLNIAKDIQPADFNFDARPFVQPWMLKLRDKGPIGILRPPTIRVEWENDSRNADPAYFDMLVKATPGIRWVAVGWLSPGKEWLAGPLPKEVERVFMNGELETEEIAGLLAVADVALSAVCFMLPMGAAIQTPTYSIFGGSIKPELLVDPCMTSVGWSAPDPFCNCLLNDHRCNKKIDVDAMRENFTRFVEARRTR